MRSVRQMQLRPKITVSELVKEMQHAGVLGAGKVGKAADLVTEMFSDPDYTVFLSVAGAMVPGGLRKVITDLIEEKFVNVIVSTGANLVHDIIEALGFSHYVGSFKAGDEKLRREGFGRIGDIFISKEALQGLEKWLGAVLEEIPEQKRQRIAPYEVLYEIGKRITDSESILAASARRDVLVFCPNLADSVAGFHMWLFSQDKALMLDPLLDTAKITEMAFDAKRTGVIILGGGWPKHYTLFANTFREGVDCAVQITMDRPEPGGLSGASLEEAISWNKVKYKDKIATVISDATIVFPLVVAAVLDQI